MSKDSRPDALKNKSKIAKVALNNPFMTQREIASELGVGKTTVQEHLKELGATKDDRIIGLTDEDFRMMTEIQRVKFKRLAEDEKINNSDLDKWENTATKRYSLFRGSATDEQGGLKGIEHIEIV